MSDLDELLEWLRENNRRRKAEISAKATWGTSHGLENLKIISEQYDRWIAAVEKLRVALDRLRKVSLAENDEICQILGKVLGYPWFKDDQATFPGATTENGVCVGDNVAVTMAMQAATRIAEHDRRVTELLSLVERSRDIINSLYANKSINGYPIYNSDFIEKMRSWLEGVEKVGRSLPPRCPRNLP